MDWIRMFLVAFVLCSLAVGLIAFYRRGDISPLGLLKAFGAPLIGLLLLIAALFRRSPSSTRQPTIPGPEDSDGETTDQRVRRVLEAEARRVKEHVLEEATDDEVAARGAGLFDPDVGA